MIIYLVRHCSHALIGKVLCGRADGIALSAEGAEQARRLADQFAARAIGLLQSSPRERAMQTAEPIASAVRIGVDETHEMDELDTGDWTGRSFDSLASDPAWLEWNSYRNTARPPRGESMAELQARVVAHLASLARTNAGSAVVVSHAEPIRAAVLHCYDIPLDRFAEIDIAPGSISIIRAEDDRMGVDAVNLEVLP